MKPISKIHVSVFIDKKYTYNNESLTRLDSKFIGFYRVYMNLVEY